MQRRPKPVPLLKESPGQEYASFTSLIWTRVRKRRHTWSWKSYYVWGEGCDRAGAGGVWYADSRDAPYKTQFDAQAAVETMHLARHPPEFLMDDVDAVWEALSETAGLTFEQLITLTNLSDKRAQPDKRAECEGRLSDALARGYELGIFKISILTVCVVYLRETRRRK